MQSPSFAEGGKIAYFFGDLAASIPCEPIDGVPAIAIGKRLDLLSLALVEAEAAGSVDKAREAVRSAGLADPQWFRNRDDESVDGAGPEAWQQYHSAQTWADIERPLNVVAGRAFFDWLACWDLDFCRCFFNRYTPQPMFPLLAPQLAASYFNGREGGQGVRKRGLIEQPMRRLLDVTAFVAHAVRFKSFPEAMPKLTDLAVWAREDVMWLSKVGLGERPLSFARYERLWKNAAGKQGPETMPAPSPLYIAAHVFDLCLVPRDKDGPLAASQFLTLSDDIYKERWNLHLAHAVDAGVVFGDGPLPTVLMGGQTADLVSTLPPTPAI